MDMKINVKEFELSLKHPFTIAKFTRTSTPLLLLRIDYQGKSGYGEASMVPYMGENYETAYAFLKKVDFSQFQFPFDFASINAYLNDIDSGNPAIKAAIALNDLNGQLLEKPCHEIYGSSLQKMPVTSFTLGIDSPEMLLKKLADAKDFKAVKVKLGRDNDREIIKTIRSATNAPLYVDANQGWSDKKSAIDLIYWLHEQGVVLIEQPMDKTNIDGNAWLTERSPIPILADEAFQRLADIEQLKGAYHGINIKLMKSTGMYEAHQMIVKAQKLGMKILIGCMSETSIASLAAAHLAPQCNWADLDGPWLTTNNPFDTPTLKDGKYLLNHNPGLGLSGAKADLFTN
jgi:L-alanine-DL-glutamate epimerase-like enolase superfamily enzyme